MQLHINSRPERKDKIKEILHFRIPWEKTTLVYLLFAIISVWKPCTIWNFHFCKDVTDILHWLQKNHFAKIIIKDFSVEISPKEVQVTDIRSIARLRSSIILVGWLLAKYPHGARLAFDHPGGCNFSRRPVDRHFELLKAFWIRICEYNESIECEKMDYMNEDVVFSCATEDFGPSVGVTIHALLLAIQHKSNTTLLNVSIEPAVLTVLKYLSQVYWDNLFSIDYQERIIHIWRCDNNIGSTSAKIILPTDISYTSTVITLCIALNKIGIIENINIPANSLKIYKDIAYLEELQDSIFLVRPKELPESATLKCECWPWFPTDSGPFFSMLFAIKNKSLKLEDTIYRERSSHVDLLRQLGIWNIKSEKNIVYSFVQTWSFSLPSNPVSFLWKDIRACATWILASLSLGVHSVVDIDQLTRGYGDLIEQLQDNWFDVYIKSHSKETLGKPFRSNYSQYRLHKEILSVTPHSKINRKIGFIGTCDSLGIQKASAYLNGVSIFNLWEHLFNPAIIQNELERIQWKRTDWKDHIIETKIKNELTYIDPVRFWEKSHDKYDLIEKMGLLNEQLVHSIKQLDFIFIFLWFDEIWENNESWFVYNRVPYELVQKWEITITPRYITIDELKTTLSNIEKLILEINPNVSICLAVSPIPNNFSYRDDANEYLSWKYKFVVGTREFCMFKNIPYLNIFEQIDRESRHMQGYFKTWQADWRHLSKEVILRLTTEVGSIIWTELQVDATNYFTINQVDFEGKIIWEF